MSGIFKGDSIYKSGGGGGGNYKDGGQLVDGDFIKVENNTVSSYDNVSRDPVNFYFEEKDGEILNSIIEFTTAVNATVNVYIYKNGFYYLIGNIGGNSVNAGDEYKINITGDSYSVEQVSSSSNDPSFVSLNGSIYPIVKTNGLYILASNYKASGNEYFYPTDVKNINISGWRIPTATEFNSFISTWSVEGLCSTTGWNNQQGTNTSGFNMKPMGQKRPNDSIQDLGASAFFVVNHPSWTLGCGYYEIHPPAFSSEQGYQEIFERRYTVRLVRAV